MYLHHFLRRHTGARMEVIYVLRDEQEVTWPLVVQSRQRAVRRIRLDRSELHPPRIVELVDESRIASERLRSRDIFNTMSFPEPVGPAKGL